MKRKRTHTLVIISIVGATLLLGCQGNGDGLTEAGDLPGDAGFAATVQPIFDANCTRCHSPGGSGYNATGGASGGLDLTSGNSIISLVGHPTFESPGTDPHWRVLAGEPDSSYIVQKISSPTPKQGNQMPSDGPPYLSAADVARITKWIEDGAADD